MEWTDRLQDLTGWNGPRWERDWADTEAALGVSLPDDFKELCARFGPGSFADYLRLLPSTEPESLLGWWESDSEFKGDPEEEPEDDIMFGPYGVYGEKRPRRDVLRRGVLRWGIADAPEGNFFWLADVAVDPNAWPILGKGDMYYGENWERFDMTVSEFVYRVLTAGDSMIFAVRASARERPRTFVSDEVYRREF